MKLVGKKVVVVVPVVDPAGAEEAGLPTSGQFAVPVPNNADEEIVATAYINYLAVSGELPAVAVQVVKGEDSGVPMKEIVGYDDLDWTAWKFEAA